MSEETNSVQSILVEAVEIHDSQQRAAFLARACGANSELRDEVEELIQAHAAASQFLPEVSAVTEVRSVLIRTVEAAVPQDRAIVSSTAGQVGDRVRHYKLLEQIGEGGWGVVYMAEQEKPVRRRVALKVIKLGMDTKQVVARFEAERQALALMDHPNIAKVFDAGQTETGRPYFVMELVRGIKITQYCDENELSTRERLELFIRVCQAVQHAHQKGVIHRDLKPSNILVTVIDAQPVPKIIDFGIAKAREGRLSDQTLFTAFDQFLGTPAYMSPEQAVMSNQDIDTRSDIYSLGVLLYELLTGKTPFDSRELLAAGLEEMRRTIREKEPLRPSTRLRNMAPKELTTAAKRRRLEPPKLIQLLRGDLDSIVGKCLEKERSRRYETANGLAADVQRHLDREPIVARPASLVYRLTKLAQRNKLAFSSAIAVVAALVLGIIASSWQAMRAERERQRFQQDVVHQYVARGSDSVNKGDLFGSLLWYTKALELDAGDARREAPHRMRIASVLRQCPKLSAFAHDGTLDYAEFSRQGDRLLTASGDRTARVWDLATGRQLVLVEHGGEVYAARFSPDDSRIVTSCQDKTARIWDSSTGACLYSLPHRDTVRSACFSPEGKLVATICDDHTAQLWDAATGRPVGRPLQDESRLVAVTFSPDGRFLATHALDYTASVWEVATGQRRFRGEYTASWTEVAFSPDSQHFLTCNLSSLHIWDVNSFQEVPFSPIQYPSILDLCYSPDGGAIITASGTFTAQAWDATTGRPLLSPAVQHKGPVTSARFSPDGRRFLTGANDALAQEWSMASGRPIGPPLKTITMSRFVAYSSDGHRLLVRGCDNVARVWDLATDDLLGPSRPLIENAQRIVDPSGRFFLRPGGTNDVWIADMQTGKGLAALPHTNQLSYASFNRDGRVVLTVSESDAGPNDVFLWEVPTGRRIPTDPMATTYRVLYAAFSPDNSSLLTCSLDFVANLWDTRTGQAKGTLRPGGRVTWGAFSPDGRRVITACWGNNTARVWDAATGKPLTPPLQHNAIIVGGVWSADGKRFTTLTEDDYLQNWDLANGEPLSPPRKVRSRDHRTALITATPQALGSEEPPMDDRPAADLVLLSETLAAARIDSSGNSVPLTTEELASASRSLRAKYPAQCVSSASEVVSWHQVQAQECEDEGRLKAALFHLDRALALRPDDSFLAQERSKVATMLERGGGSGIESARSSLALRIPARDLNADENQIDLSKFYNLTLEDSFDQPGDRNNLAELPLGRQMLGGVRFDVRGVVRLNGRSAKRAGQAFPESAKGIRVGRKCQRLSFLQATSSWENAVAQVGTYVLHYTDGESRELPVIFGRDIASWWFEVIPGGISEADGAVVAWTGHNPGAAKGEASICLYRSTRKNPRPDVKLESIDFVSSLSEAAPFLVALTVE